MSNGFFRVQKGVSLTPQSTAPLSANDGDSYYDSTDGVFKFRQGGSWVGMGDSAGPLIGKSIQDPTRLDPKKDTFANLTTYAATANNGELVFATDTKEMYHVVDGALTAIGGSTESATAVETAEIIILNNQSSAVNTGISFSYPTVKSFEITAQVIRTTSTSEASEFVKIYGIYHSGTSTWEITDTGTGASGVVFTMTAAGVLQYTSSNLSGSSYDGKMNYCFAANGGALVGNNTSTISSSSGINYISDTELGLSSWVTYADAAAATPVDGTGGTANITLTVDTSTPIRGLKSLLLTKDAANRQGQGISFPFTIATADQAQILRVSFDYSSSAGYVDDYARVYVYDVTNSQLIEVIDRTIGASTYGKYVGSFQTNSNSLSYRLIVHVADSSTTAWTMKLDNIIVGPQTLIKGPIVTDWQSYTPTLVGFGTAANVNFKYRQVGDSYEVRGTFEVGTPTAVAGTLTLPGGVSIDTNKLHPFGASASSILGTYNATNNAGASGVWTVGIGGVLGTLTGVATDKIFFGYQNAADAGSAVVSLGVNGSTLFNAGANIDLRFIVPIAGKSSNVILSEDSGSRLVLARMSRVAVQSVPTGSSTTFVPDTVNDDTVGAFNLGTSLYTIPETGYYDITGFVSFAANSTGVREVQIRVNSTVIAYQTTNAITLVMGVNATVLSRKLIKGDTVLIQCFQSSGGSLNATGEFSIHKVQSPQTLAGSETVAARAVQTSGQSINSGSTTAITWDSNKTRDTHNALSGTTFTTPVSGWYHITSQIFYTSQSWTAGNTMSLHIYKNGSVYSRLNFVEVQVTRSSNYELRGSDSIYLNKGDTVDVRATHNRGSATALINNPSSDNYISIERIGN